MYENNDQLAVWIHPIGKSMTEKNAKNEAKSLVVVDSVKTFIVINYSSIYNPRILVSASYMTVTAKLQKLTSVKISFREVNYLRQILHSHSVLSMLSNGLEVFGL